MNFLPSDIFYITYDEFYLLLAAAGRKEIYSIDSFSGTDIPEKQEEIYPIIAGLYKKGLFDWEDGKVSVAEDYGPVVRVMRDAKWCMISAVAGDGDGFAADYFSGDTVMKIKRSQHDTDTLAISFETSGEMIEALGRDEVLPEPIQAGNPEPLEKYMVLDEDMKITDCLEDEQVRYVAELRNAYDGSLAERLIVYDEGLYSVIYRQERSKCRYYVCEREIWESMIRSWMIGGVK